MTKRSIRNAFNTIIIALIMLMIIGIIISYCDTTDKRIVFSTYKDLLPLIISAAAAWLGYCVQRRSAYQQQLRVLWSRLIDAVQLAKSYTQLESPTEQQYRETLGKMSNAIEEVRGVFCNLSVSKTNRGLYPFEPLKDIFSIVENLKYNSTFQRNEANKSYNQIDNLWKDVRQEILKEFDREEPTFSHSLWVNEEHRKIYEKHQIPPRAS